MNNIFDYLKWRGDLTLRHSRFNVVDSLILSMLAYVPFEGIVPDTNSRKSITIAGASAALAMTDAKKLPLRNPDDLRLLHEAARTARFADMRLFAYVNSIDKKKQKQFSAISVRTGDFYTYVAYRGTDLTLVGWKEDFNMTFLSQIPSQAEAVDYLKIIAGKTRGRLRLGGHSKGGNLAVYAAAFGGRLIQRRIAAIYNNDGPGFASSVISQKGYRNILSKIQTFIPQSSVIGMLLEHNEKYTVVNSDESGLMQHEAYSWSVLGNDFVRREGLDDSSHFIERTLKDWLYRIEPQRREKFFDALYEIVSSAGAHDISGLSRDWFNTGKAMIRSLKKIDEQDRKMLLETVGVLFDVTRKNLERVLPEKISKNIGTLLPGGKNRNPQSCQKNAHNKKQS